MIEWEPALRPEQLQNRFVRAVLRAWDALPREQRNVRRLVAHWTWCGSAQTFQRWERGR